MKCRSYQSFLPFLIGVFLFFTACQPDKAEKDSTDPAPASAIETETEEPHKCRLIQTYEYETLTKYFYDNSNRVEKIFKFNHKDSTRLDNFLIYTYNPQGSAAEELQFAADSTLYGKRSFIYNAQNQLIRINYIYNISGQLILQPRFVTIKYDNAGIRNRTDYHGFTGTNSLEYTEATFLPNKVFTKEYEGGSTQPVLVAEYEMDIDNYNSPYHALGYLSEYTGGPPHNTLLIKIMRPGEPDEFLNASYKYNSQGYPIESSGQNNVGWPSRTTFKYACH